MKYIAPIEQWNPREGASSVWRGTLNGLMVGLAIGAAIGLFMSVGCLLAGEVLFTLGMMATKAAGGAFFGATIGTVIAGAKYVIDQLKPRQTVTVDIPDERLLPPAPELTPQIQPTVSPSLAEKLQQKLLGAPQGSYKDRLNQPMPEGMGRV